MLKVLFFGQVRERLDCASLTWQGAGLDLDALQEQLSVEKGGLWREVLGQKNIIRAVNQVVISDNCALEEGDEVAFFPPVTGG